MRFLSLLLPLTLLASPAMADESKSLKDHLPSEAEVEKIISELPDFNHMMDGLMAIAQDEKLREKLTDSAAQMKDKLEQSGALDTRGNGMPDINAAMAVMLRTFTDKDGIGGMIDALEDVSEEFGEVMEESLKNTPKSTPKSTPQSAPESTPNDKSNLSHNPAENNIGLTDI